MLRPSDVPTGLTITPYALAMAQVLPLALRAEDTTCNQYDAE